MRALNPDSILALMISRVRSPVKRGTIRICELWTDVRVVRDPTVEHTLRAKHQKQQRS